MWSVTFQKNLRAFIFGMPIYFPHLDNVLQKNEISRYPQSWSEEVLWTVQYCKKDNFLTAVFKLLMAVAVYHERKEIEESSPKKEMDLWLWKLLGKMWGLESILRERLRITLQIGRRVNSGILLYWYTLIKVVSVPCCQFFFFFRTQQKIFIFISIQYKV